VVNGPQLDSLDIGVTKRPNKKNRNKTPPTGRKVTGNLMPWRVSGQLITMNNTAVQFSAAIAASHLVLEELGDEESRDWASAECWIRAEQERDGEYPGRGSEVLA
jgi:hypothetical protein